MSRIAKSPVTLPEKVELTLSGKQVNVKGNKGELSFVLNSLVEVSQVDGNSQEFICKPKNNSKEAWAQTGTARALINNMVHGVSIGFKKTLVLVGVGYRAQQKGNDIVLSLGFSHPVNYQLPASVSASIANPTEIVLESIDKQALGQVASEIRSIRPPEPYKGKGVKYSDEIIVRKETKKK